MPVTAFKVGILPINRGGTTSNFVLVQFLLYGDFCFNGGFMDILKFPSDESVNKAISADEPLIAAIAFDGKTAIMSQIDDALEHHILLMKAGLKDTDIDRYFRIIVDKSGADWTFICPPDYKNIPYKDKRIEAFYKDGFSVISDFLHSIGYLVGINIPKRYRRHFDAICDEKSML